MLPSVEYSKDTVPVAAVGATAAVTVNGCPAGIVAGKLIVVVVGALLTVKGESELVADR